jgi:photosystem II stability/assembly factor-like uncharacterized protein
MRECLQKQRVIFFIIACLSWIGGCTDTALLLVPDFAEWSVDQDGYQIETLPMKISASFARGRDIYLSDSNGELFKADDNDLQKTWVSLGKPLNYGARMIFVSNAGTVFTSNDDSVMYRSSDEGKTWQPCLPVPVWRMTEDDCGGLYAGNYCSWDGLPATVYKSEDEGVTWNAVFQTDDGKHIHTVGWDEIGKKLYVAWGDGAKRGEGYSADYGETFHVIARGPFQGHTDVAFTNNYMIWASDDQTGRVFRVSRKTGQSETLMGRSQFMWFAVADGEQIYVGTMTSKKEGGERAALLASSDQGSTWQKVLETDVSTGPYTQGFNAESRRLSANGWFYCSDMTQSYRIRRIQN